MFIILISHGLYEPFRECDSALSFRIGKLFFYLG